MSDSVAERFYSAFAARDWRTMGSLYADDARFSDPAFVDLDAREVRAMWRMLITRGTDLTLQYQVLAESADAASVRWVLALRDGAIVRHADAFDFHRWARQALGVPGLLLGWTPFFRRAVQGKARAGLRQFLQRLDQDKSR